MPRLAITHITTYQFGSPVELGQHRLMLRPRETRDLTLITFELDVTPGARIDWSHDVAGNSIALASFSGSADNLRIEARTTVDQKATVWPVFAISASAIEWPFLYNTDDFVDLGALATPQYVDPAGRLSQWARQFVMGKRTDTLSLLKDLSNGVAEQIAYQSRETEGTQGPLDTLDRGWGTCRDFAVLFAEAARTLGFGSRLVSGYLQDFSGSSVGSSGTGSTHAWVEVFVPGAGWITFDPTNRAVGSAHLIPVAVARNIEQIAPVIGSFTGSKTQMPSMEILVDVSLQT